MVRRANRPAGDNGRSRCRRRLQSDGSLRGDQPKPQRQLGFLVGPQEHVDGWETSSQAGPLGLADATARQHDSEAGLSSLELGELALAADDLRLGVLADGAGVDDDQVGQLHRGCSAAPDGEQLTGHLLGVAQVHLAAERPDEEAGHLVGAGPELGDGRIDGRGRGAAPHLDPTGRQRRESPLRPHGHEGEASVRIVKRRRPSSANRFVASSSGT